MLKLLGSKLQQTNKNKFIRCTIIMLVTNWRTNKTVRCRYYALKYIESLNMST